MSELTEKTKKLLKKRPYLAQWFTDQQDAASKGHSLRTPIVENIDQDLVDELLNLTPSQIAVGRSGTRFKTKDTIQMRAGHAIAKDAVYSEVQQEVISKLDCIALHSQCENREDYLLNPSKGRRLQEDSIQKLEDEGTHGVDLQIIVGDGLAAWAIEKNAAEFVEHFQALLQQNNISFGRTIFVRYARVGVQDQIGVMLKAKATIILIGERPGLGTGDSLSAYIAYGPKLDQDNAEKNCISNIRALGILPKDAAVEAVQILKRAFETGRGGVVSP